MSNCIIRNSSSKIVHLFHIALFVVLDLVTLCKYCNLHSEVYFNNKFGIILYLPLFVQELYSKNRGGGGLKSPVTTCTGKTPCTGELVCAAQSLLICTSGTGLGMVVYYFLLQHIDQKNIHISEICHCLEAPC